MTKPASRSCRLYAGCRLRSNQNTPQAWSRWNATPPVSTTSTTFDTSNGGSLALISSIRTYCGLAAAFPTRSLPRLLNAAAVGGLEPPSERRLRGVYPHLRHSTASRPDLRSWHTCKPVQVAADRFRLPRSFAGLLSPPSKVVVHCLQLLDVRHTLPRAGMLVEMHYLGRRVFK